jgi:SAM-dependent methyltransferase
LPSEDQARWDKRHGSAAGAEAPADFLRQIFSTGAWPLPRGRALDIACGKGRHSLYLTRLGFDVVGLDISALALSEARARAERAKLRIDWRQADLEASPIDDGGFDLIVNINYLQRSLIAQIKRAVRVGGQVIFETFLIDQQALGHPSNPDYLLRRNELLELFRGFRVLQYREGLFPDTTAPAHRAGIFAERIVVWQIKSEMRVKLN